MGLQDMFQRIPLLPTFVGGVCGAAAYAVGVYKGSSSPGTISAATALFGFTTTKLLTDKSQLPVTGEAINNDASTSNESSVNPEPLPEKAVEPVQDSGDASGSSVDIRQESKSEIVLRPLPDGVKFSTTLELHRYHVFTPGYPFPLLCVPPQIEALFPILFQEWLHKTQGDAADAFSLPRHGKPTTHQLAADKFFKLLVNLGHGFTGGDMEKLAELYMPLDKAGRGFIFPTFVGRMRALCQSGMISPFLVQELDKYLTAKLGRPTTA